MEEKYAVPVLAVNAESMTEEEIRGILRTVLFEFPRDGRRQSACPNGCGRCPKTIGLSLEFLGKSCAKPRPSLCRMKDCLALEKMFEEGDAFVNPEGIAMDLGKGKAELSVGVREGLFHEVLSEECGESIPDDFALLRYAKSLSASKKSYDRIREAFEEAEANGYGTVSPSAEDMALDPPRTRPQRARGTGVHFQGGGAQLSHHKGGGVGRGQSRHRHQTAGGGIRRGSAFRVRIPSRKGLGYQHLRQDAARAGRGRACGKGGRHCFPPNLRKKMRRTITRIVNEGRGGVICILL